MSNSYRCTNCNWLSPPFTNAGLLPRCLVCGARLRRHRARTRVDPYAGVELAYHVTFEGWEQASLYWSPDAANDPYRKEHVELAAVLRRRVVAHRRPMRMEPPEVLAVLSGLPASALEGASFRSLRRHPTDQSSPRSSLTLGEHEFLARSPVVAAVVAAAHVTRRPFRALTALASRLLMEGRAVVRVMPEEK